MRVENIRNDKDVVKFLLDYAKGNGMHWRNVNLDYKDRIFKKYYSIDDIRLMDSIAKQKWLLRDFNEDSMMDLVVACKIYNQYKILGFISYNDSTYSLLDLSTTYSNYFPSGIYPLDNGKGCQFILESHGKINSISNMKVNYRRDTLVYKISSFIEYDNIADDFAGFDSLRFSISYIWPTGVEIPKMTLYNDGRVVLIQSKYVDTAFMKKWTNGIKTCEISMSEIDLINKLLREIHYINLMPNYEVDGSDFPTYVTEVFYKGNSKRVWDYGAEGTYSLRLLYKELGRIKNICKGVIQ